MTRGIMEAAAAAGAKLVFADNLSMYGPVDGPMTEESPPVAQTKKGKVRAAMAEELLAAHRDGRLRVVIGRSSDYFGPGGPSSAVGERFFKAVLAGKKARWFADLDQPHTMSYLPDMARAFVVLGERPEADGQVWHTPSAPALTGRQYIELAARLAGTAREAGGAGAWGRCDCSGCSCRPCESSRSSMYQYERPFVSDAGKFEAAFGPFAVTPHEDALRTTLEWYREPRLSPLGRPARACALASRIQTC